MEHFLDLPNAYDQYIRTDAARLFLKDSEFSRLEFEYVKFGRGVVPSRLRIQGVGGQEKVDHEINVLEAADRVLILLPQEDSHGSFLITESTFRKLVSPHNILPQFFESMKGFGYRTRDGEECGTYSRRLSEDPAGAISEFCFDIRHPARHGRTHPSDPWSGMRHMAFYQKLNIQDGSLVLLLLQPSDEVKSRFPEVLGSQNLPAEVAPVVAPLLFLSIAAGQWRSYLEHLEGEVHKLETKTLLASVVKKHREDWEITFRDAQSLQRLKRRLLKAQGALNSSEIIALGFKDYYEELTRLTEVSQAALKDISDRLSMHLVQIKTHLGVTSRLLSACDGISKVAFDLLAYTNSEKMKEVAKSSHEGNEHARLDSRNVKILTFIGTLYLPATLVATVFSSDLVNTSQSSTKSRLALSPQFWLYPVITLAVMSATLFPILLLFKYTGRPGPRDGDAEAAGLEVTQY